MAVTTYLFSDIVFPSGTRLDCPCCGHAAPVDSWCDTNGVCPRCGDYCSEMASLRVKDKYENRGEGDEPFVMELAWQLKNAAQEARKQRQEQKEAEAAAALPPAVWMAATFLLNGVLWQRDAAKTIHAAFGKAFTYSNKNGNLAIEKCVLDQFRKITGNWSIIWDKTMLCWRKRHPWEKSTSRMST